MLNITTENDDIFRAGANTKCVNGVNPGRPQIYKYTQMLSMNLRGA